MLLVVDAVSPPKLYTTHHQTSSLAGTSSHLESFPTSSPNSAAVPGSYTTSPQKLQ